MQVTNVPDAKSPVGGQTDFCLIQGETVDTVLTITNGGAPLDLTGFTGKMEILGPNGIGSILLTTENGGISFPDAVNGSIQINVTSAQTAAMAVASHPYDLFLLAPTSGPAKAYIGGNFRIQQARTILS